MMMGMRMRMMRVMGVMRVCWLGNNSTSQGAENHYQGKKYYKKSFHK
jgi:hypothetical protein